ncbi:MAG: S8 family serine peptidase, partial [Acidimicrobiia bacterium]
MPLPGFPLLAAAWAALLTVATALPAGAQIPPGREHPRLDPRSSQIVPGEVAVLLEAKAPGPTLQALGQAGEVRVSAVERLRLVRVPEGTEQQVAEQLEHLPGVLVAEPNVVRSFAASPNDPLYSSQWNLSAIGLDQARELSTGNGVTIAVIDSGVAYAPCSGSACSPNGDAGAAPDLTCHGAAFPYDFVWDDPFPDDETGHGTAVATVAMACTDEGYGMAGVAPSATLMPLKACHPFGCSAFDEAVSIIWAADHGATVVNISLGGGYSEIEDFAVQYAFGEGVVLVAASGNDGTNLLDCPACLPEVISVGATRSDGGVPSYSNGGTGFYG